MVPLAVYGRTLARHVPLLDSGELAAAAAVLGIAHPPGYPLFVLIGHILSWIPFESVIFRIGLLSALGAAGATLLLFRGLVHLLRARSLPVVATIYASVGLFAFGQTTWSQATIVEVYPLQVCLVAAFFVATIRSGTGGQTEEGQGPILVGLLFGLALTNHLTAILLLPSYAVALVWIGIGARRSGRRCLTRIVRSVAAVAAPLLLYLVIPIRSRMHPPVNWNHPESLEALLVHVTGRQYHGQLGREGVRLTELRRFLVEQLPGEATVVVPILALIGIVVLARRDRRALLLTAPFFIAILVYNMAYPIHDITVYYLPALWIVALWASFGAGWIASRLDQNNRLLGVLFAIGLLAATTVQFTGRFASHDRRNDTVVSDYVRDCVRYADRDAVLFSGDWDRFSSPVLYLQVVEKLRSDLVIIDMGRIASPTLGLDLEQVFPELAAACATEIATGCELAHQAERGEMGDVAAARAAYQSLQHCLVRESLRLRPTYVVDGLFQHPIFRGYPQHPEGLLVRLTNDPSYRPFPVPAFTRSIDSDDRPMREQERIFAEEYLRMLDGRIRYLEHHGKTEEIPEIERLMRRLAASDRFRSTP